MSDSIYDMNIPNGKSQEINDIISMLKNEKRKYRENEIFKDLLLETVSDKKNGLKEMLRVKIRDIIIRAGLVENLRVKNSEKYELLDLENFTNLELIYEEKKELQRALEEKITEKKETLLKNISEVNLKDYCSVEDLINDLKLNENKEKEKIIDGEKNINELYKQHVQVMIEYGELLLKLLELKTENVPEVKKNISKNLSELSEIRYLRSKILEYKSKNMVFGEKSLSLEAYDVAYKDLREKQKNCEKEIEELKCNLEKYNDLSKNQEYMVILNNYKMHLNSLESYKFYSKGKK